MTDAPERTEVLVAGAGLSGLTLAAGFASAGVQCMVVDPAAGAERKDARTTAIACGSRRLYEALEVWPAVRDDAQPIRRIRVAENDVPLFLHFETDEVGEGPAGHIVPNQSLHRALRSRLARSGVEAQACAVEGYTEQSGWVSVRLSDGRTIETRILVGADGRKSPVRDLAGIRAYHHAYRQTAMVCTVRHTAPHRDTAVERFLPSGPFAVLPLRGEKSAVVWTERSTDADRLMEMPRAAFQAELETRFADMFGEPTLEGEVQSFPLSLTLARRHVRGRVVLVGDAAHALHPIAGQGFNLGVRGIALLVELVADQIRLGLDPGDTRTLGTFAERRCLDTAALVTVTHSVNRLFSNDIPGLSMLRAWGLGTVNAMPFMKRLLMRNAMGVATGIAGPLPRLIQGQPI